MALREGAEEAANAESASAGMELAARVVSLLERPLSAAEARAWVGLSPALRRRAEQRIELMGRWTGDRGGLTAEKAGELAGVSTKRFYQMASAWKKEPGLMAVGVYAAAAPSREPRTDPRVNAVMQAKVVKVVNGVGEAKKVNLEALRRELEAEIRRELPEMDQDNSKLTMPSLNLVRAVITRELNRRAEMKLAAESVVLDCVPVAMRQPGGEPWVLFAIIDRGTLRILGHAFGELTDSVHAYGRAAANALDRLADPAAAALPWSSATRRLDVVVGLDDRAWLNALPEWRRRMGTVNFDLSTREKRFGSQFRQYIGDRVGRVVLRPTWVSRPPADLAAGEQIFDRAEAEERMALETAAYNMTKALSREGAAATAPPPEFVEALRLLAGGVGD